MLLIDFVIARRYNEAISYLCKSYTHWRREYHAIASNDKANMGDIILRKLRSK
jgi:hypothetical protein